MKLKLIDGIANKRTPAVLCVLAGVCLLTTAVTYHEITTILGPADRSSELTLKLLAAEQDSMLLRQIAAGKEDYAKTFLTSAITYNLKEVANLAPGAEESRLAFVVNAVKGIERQKKQSRAIYLASSQRNNSVATVAAH
jgi:hypothetical protein